MIAEGHEYLAGHPGVTLTCPLSLDRQPLAIVAIGSTIQLWQIGHSFDANPTLPLLMSDSCHGLKDDLTANPKSEQESSQICHF